MSQADVLNSYSVNPRPFARVKIGVVAVGFLLNLVLACSVFAELLTVAKQQEQRLVLYLKEVMLGGLSPLPHVLQLREGSVAEVDYEVRVCRLML